MITVKLKGLAEEIRKAKALPAKLKRELGQEINDVAYQIARGAKRDAPKDQGTVVREISVAKVGELKWTVVSQADHSGFLEFGTKTRVIIPPGLEEEAARVRSDKRSSSLSAKEAIFNWCKRHGIEERAWYPIYISIMVNGIYPRPFFYKQVEIVRPQFEKNVQAILNEQRL